MQPDILWSDGEAGADVSYWRSLEFLAWLYTDSPVTKTVLTNDRWGRGTQCHHGDFFTCGDRNNPRKLLKHKWENALTLDRLAVNVGEVLTNKAPRHIKTIFSISAFLSVFMICLVKL